MADTYAHLDSLKRDELGEWRAAADAVDEWMLREHGRVSGRHNLGHLLDLLAEQGYHLLTPAEHRAVTAQHDLVQQILADQDSVFAARLQAAMDSVTAREATPDA